MLRFDAYGKLPWERKKDGRYWTHITLGEVGSRMTYYSPRGDKRVETVEERGLFNDDSVRSLSGLPVLLKHTKYNLNQDGLRIGSILSNVAIEDNKLIAEVIIDDFRGVKLLDRFLGKGITPEASSGYHVKELIEREDGLLEQIRGEYDHVLAPISPGTARAGRGITLRFDSCEDDAVSDRQYFIFKGENMPPTDTNSGKKMIIRMDKKDIILENVSSETEEVLNFQNDRIDSLTANLQGSEEKIAELENKVKTLESEIARTDSIDPEAIEGEIALRMDAWGDITTYAPHIKPDYKLSQVDIFKKGIAAIAPSINLDSLDDNTIKGIWQGIKATANSKRDINVDATRSTDGFLSGQRNGDRADSIPKTTGREKARSAYENASKKDQ